MGGYTKMVEHLLEGIEVRLGIDYLEQKEELKALAEKTVYTGAIDAYFDYSLIILILSESSPENYIFFLFRKFFIFLIKSSVLFIVYRIVRFIPRFPLRTVLPRNYSLR